MTTSYHVMFCVELGYGDPAATDVTLTEQEEMTFTNKDIVEKARSMLIEDLLKTEGSLMENINSNEDRFPEEEEPEPVKGDNTPGLHNIF